MQKYCQVQKGGQGEEQVWNGDLAGPELLHFRRK